MPDQTPYTPSLEEIARTILPMFDQLATAVHHDGPYSEAESAMDAATALMPLVKRAQAEAIREAAEALNTEFQDIPAWTEAYREGVRTNEWMKGGTRMVMSAVDVLRARADRIEQGENDD